MLILKCRDIGAQASDFLEGQMGLTKRLAYQTHVLFCPNCRRFLKQFQLTLMTLKHWPSPRLSPLKQEQMEQQILVALERRSPQGRNP